MYGKILIPIDPEKLSWMAFLHAFRIAEMCNSEVYIIHASSKLLSDDEEMMLRVSLDKFHNGEDREIRRVTGMVLEFLQQEGLRELACKISYKIDVIPEHDDRIKAIHQFCASNGIDLIVLGMKSRRSALELFKSNISKWATLFPECPVLVVHDVRD